jgi:hypothetical protein
MRRREFITLLGGAAAAWPLAGHAQQPAMPVIGYLRSTTVGPAAPLLVALRKGLAEAGFTDGENVAIDERYADDDRSRLPALARQLVQRKGGDRHASILGAGRHGGNPDHPNRLCQRRRPGARRPGAKSQPARRQCHGYQLLHQPADRQANGVAERTGS